MSTGSSSSLDSSHQREETKRTARSHFDRWAATYDRSWLSELVFHPSIRACHEEILRWQAARGAHPYRLLDVGCGTGNLLLSLTRDPLAAELVGLDYSPEMVQRCRRKFTEADADGRLRIVHGDAENLPFEDGFADVVTCCNSFHHYPHQPAVVREFHRVLRPDGLLVLVDGFRDNVIGWIVFDVGVALVERMIHHAAWSEVRDMITAAGFRALRQRKLNVLAPLLVSVARR